MVYSCSQETVHIGNAQETEIYLLYDGKSKKRAWLTELEKEDRPRSPACIVFGRQRSWTVGEKSMGRVSSIPSAVEKGIKLSWGTRK